MIAPNTQREAFVGESFYIALHDVTPVFARQIFEISDCFEKLVGTRLAAAYVPHWHGRPTGKEDSSFVREVKERFDEVLLHGYTHQREQGRGPISLITGSADEFNGLSDHATRRRLALGQQFMTESFGGPATGFVAPTFQRGRITLTQLASHGMQFYVGFGKMHFVNCDPIRLATWCWDMSPWRAAGYLGHGIGKALMKMRPAALPCLALHPLDVDRGFLKRAIRLTQRLLDEGRQPLLGADLIPSTNRLPGSDERRCA